jgi:hypothetical protein
VLSGSLRPHAHAQLAKGDTEGETATKSYARHAFEVTHKAVGRAAPLVALLAVLRSYILPSKHFLSSLFLETGEERKYPQHNAVQDLIKSMLLI